MISIKNLTIQYASKTILTSQNYLFHSGKLYVLSGKSGCGKSSLLTVLGLLQKQPNDLFEIDGIQINNLKEKDLSELRRQRISFIFQEKNLFSDLSVEENITLNAYLSGSSVNEKEIQELLKQVSLEVHLDEKIHQLSGGEKQRLAIACALACNTDIILSDEPTSGLDPKNEAQIISLFQSLAHDYGKTVIIASHSQTMKDSADFIYDLPLCNKVDCESTEKQIQKHDFPMNHAFYSFYLRSSSLIKSKFNLLLLILLGTVVAIGVSSLNIRSYIIESNENKINDTINTELIIYSSTGVDEDDIVFFEKIKYVGNAHYYYSIEYEHYNLSNYIAYKNPIELDQGQMIITPSLSKQLNLNIGDTYFIEELNQSFEVLYILSEPIHAFCDLNVDSIYIADSYFQDIQPDTLLLHITSFYKMEEVVNKIESLNLSSTLIQANEDYITYTSLQQQLIRLIFIFSVIIVVILLILTNYIEWIELNSHKYDFALLKAKGIDHLKLTRLSFIRTVIRILILSVFSTAILILINLIFVGFKMIRFNQIFAGIGMMLGFNLISSFIPMLITILLISVLSPNILLKN